MLVAHMSVIGFNISHFEITNWTPSWFFQPLCLFPIFQLMLPPDMEFSKLFTIECYITKLASFWILFHISIQLLNISMLSMLSMLLFFIFRNFYYFSSDWKYRNDIDTIGLRYGCTFTGFTSTGFTGNKMTLTAGPIDR